jgi:outer membrane protein
MRTLSFSILFLSFALCSSTLEAQFSGAVPGTDQVTGTLTLQQAVAMAIKNNLSVNNVDIQSQAAKINFDQAWEYMLPTLSGNVGQQLNFGRNISSINNSYTNTQNEQGSAGLNAGVVLFRGLQYQNNLKAQRYGFQASKKDLQWQKDNITLTTLNAYLQLLSNRDQLTLAIDQSRSDSVQLMRLRALGREGALSPASNLTDLEGAYANDQVNIAGATQALENSKVNLFNILNIPYNRDLQYENSVVASDIAEYQAAPDTIFRRALGFIPIIQSTELKEMQYRRALAAARGAYFPSISLNGGISTNWTNSPGGTFTPTDSGYVKSQTFAVDNAGSQPIYQYGYTKGNTTYPDWWNQFKNNRGEYIGISVNIPILNGFQTRNNVRQARLNLETAQLNKANARNIIQQNVENAFQNMVAAYKSYKGYIDAAKAYEESFRITNIRFTEGVIASDVYIQAKTRSDLAEVNLSAAKYIYIFRTKVLDYYQGKLDLTR